MAKIKFSVSYVKDTLKSIRDLEDTNSRLEEELEKETDETKRANLQSAIELNRRSIADIENKLKNEIEEEIGRLNRHADRMSVHLDKILSTLKLELNIELTDTRELLKGLSEELGDLNKEANNLKIAIGEFKELTNKDAFDIPLEEVINKIINIKDRVRELKREQIKKYNDRVERIKSVIEEYKAKYAENTEAMDLLNRALDGLSRCDANVRDWQAIGFLEQINYAKLADAVSLIKRVEEMDPAIGQNPVQPEPTFGSLDDHLEYIRTKVAELEAIVSMEDTMDYATYVDATVKLEEIKDLLIAFNNELEKQKGEISSEKYQEYMNAHRDLMLSYMALVDRLNKIGRNVSQDEIVDYNSLMVTFRTVEREVYTYRDYVSALFGSVMVNLKDLFEKDFQVLSDKVSEFEKKVEAAYKDKLIDDNQYNNLKAKVERLNIELSDTKNKLQDVGMYSLVNPQDIYSFLNGEISGIEKTLDGLETALIHLPKPIKDRQDRKNIDAIFKRLEVEIQRLEKQLELYKDKDPDKYKETKDRLKKTKKRMNDLGKQYRRKCPLLVRAVKSAKHLFKKYKKALLVIAGLVAFAMLSHSVIIPAIMHGNIMTAYFSPALRGPIKTINNLLGGLIGASKNSLGIWSLANGSILNPSAATASLLKGLAISGIGSAALVAPLIVAIKKLIEKINMAELKQKLSDGAKVTGNAIKTGVEFVAGGIVTGVTAVKDKTDELVENTKQKNSKTKARKDLMKDMKTLIADFVKSGKTIDEYCEENQLTDYQEEFLRKFEKDALENRENMDKRKGGK